MKTRTNVHVDRGGDQKKKKKTWIKQSVHRNEYDFWKYVYQKKWDSLLKKRGIVVPYSLTIQSKKPFCFQMEMRHGGHTLLECLSSLRSVQYPSLFHSFWRMCETLGQLGIVHGDIHFKNILIQSNFSSISLIDFGISSVSPQQNPLHDMYLWSREDVYRFLKSLWDGKVLGLTEELIQTDFRKDRVQWKRWFKAHPEQWTLFQSHFKKWFRKPMIDSPFGSMMDTFLKNILSSKSNWIPIRQQHFQERSVFKLLLERFSFLYQIECTDSSDIKDLVLSQYIHQFIHQVIFRSTS